MTFHDDVGPERHPDAGDGGWGMRDGGWLHYFPLPSGNGRPGNSEPLYNEHHAEH